MTKEIQLTDTADVVFKHGQNTKRIIVRATTKNGKSYKLKFKKTDANTITIKNRDTMALRVSVVAKPKLDDQKWYKTAQVVARGLMLVRNASVTYRNTYAMTLPGFRNEVGDAFGQKSIGGLMSPGLDFAFGAIDDSYIEKAVRRGWLIQNDSSITTPATTTASEDLQLKLTLEPFTDFKVDLNASRTVNRSKSIQFMYEGLPTTQSGSFSMTVISIGTAFSGSGNINNNYNSKPFNKFLDNISVVRDRVENLYSDAVYPAGAGEYAGKPYDPSIGSVSEYSADVMVPAFLSAYCGTDASKTPLSIFPSVLKMLPNWKVTYSGLIRLPWFQRNFKSFNINHQYKSIYSVGAYNSYTNYMAYMGDLGFISDVTTGNPIPSSMYNVSTVSINESFSPLIGVDMTFNNSMTAKLEFKKTRVLNLSMTSVALTESYSDDIVVGWGYKITNLRIGSSKKARRRSDGKGGTTAGTTHDLNLRCDFSYRMQNALNRNIQTCITTATSGSTAYKLAVTADYTLSRLITVSGYFDWQHNVPLVSASSYPTTTIDFGFSMKFSLTR